jgi:nucleotide-binding universal stress UspA family protein
MSGQDRRVVVGVSGSIANLASLHEAIALARASGRTLTAVHAWAPAGGEITYRHSPCPTLLTVWARAAADRLREAFQDAMGGIPDDLAVELRAIRGTAGPVLVSAADRSDDLLVIGAGRRSLIVGRLRANVTRYCLRHSAATVVAVPPPALLRELHHHHRWTHEQERVLPGL